jgi:hypothetical protein
VVALQKLISPTKDDSSAWSRNKPEFGGCEGQLSMSHALRIQSAHYWLELGEVDQALLELAALSTLACNHPLAMKARVAVLQAVRKRNEAPSRNRLLVDVGTTQMHCPSSAIMPEGSNDFAFILKIRKIIPEFQAQLVRYLDGKCELRCGSKEGRLAAKTWISMFWHDAVVREI